MHLDSAMSPTRLFGTGNTRAGIRNSRESLSGYRPPAMLAAAEGTRPNALKGRVRLGQNVFLLPHQVERHFLLKLMAAKVPQVKRHVRESATGFTSRWDQSLFLQMRHIPAKAIGQSCKAPAISAYFSCCHGSPQWFND